MTKRTIVRLPFMFIGFVVAMLFGLVWWQALTVVLLSSFYVIITTETR